MRDVTVNMNENFANEHSQTQKTCNIFFGTKQCNTTLHQTNIGKQEFGKMPVTDKTKKNSWFYNNNESMLFYLVDHIAAMMP